MDKSWIYELALTHWVYKKRRCQGRRLMRAVWIIALLVSFGVGVAIGRSLWEGNVPPPSLPDF
jgi:hypothetical protein